MLIECGGLDRSEAADSVIAPRLTMAAIVAANAAITNTERLRASKLALLNLLLDAGVDVLFARADGSGDEGTVDELACYVAVTEDQREECEVPGDAEDLVYEIMNAMDVGFNGEGGFFEITITTATRECEIEVGYYYTASESETETETL